MFNQSYWYGGLVICPKFGLSECFAGTEFQVTTRVPAGGVPKTVEPVAKDNVRVNTILHTQTFSRD